MTTVAQIAETAGPRLTSEQLDAFAAAWSAAWTLLPTDWAAKFEVAPASAHFHQNYAGGLLEHCTAMGLWLYSRTADCCQSEQQQVDLTVVECARIALFHDLCKVGLYALGDDGAWHSDKEMYKHHALLSVQRCEQLGITLSEKERVCILLHMAGGWWNAEDEGALSEKDREWVARNLRTIAAVQWADMKAC